MEKKKGFIKSMIPSRGFGYIRKEDGSDIYFHFSGVVNPTYEELREGNIVEFMVLDVPKGEKAIAITLIREENYG